MYLIVAIYLEHNIPMMSLRAILITYICTYLCICIYFSIKCVYLGGNRGTRGTIWKNNMHTHDYCYAGFKLK